MKRNLLLLIVLSFVLFGCTISLTTTNKGYDTTTEITTTETTQVNLTQICDINEINTLYHITGQVVAVSLKSFLIQDDTGSIYVYLGKQPELSVGDVIQLSGKTSLFEGIIQISSSISYIVIENKPINNSYLEFNGKLLDSYLSKPSISYIKISGALEIIDNRYNVIVSDASKAVLSVYFPSSDLNIEQYEGIKADYYGYVVYASGGKYCTFLCNRIELSASNKISDINLIGEEYQIECSIVDTLGEYYYVSDDTGYFLLTKGNSSFIKGDTVKANGVLRKENNLYLDVNEITYIAHTVVENKVTKIDDLDSFCLNPIYREKVKFVVLIDDGTATLSGTLLNVLGTNLSSFEQNNVLMEGFLLSYNDGVVDFYCTDISIFDNCNFISDINSVDSYKIKGTVIAISEVGFLINDGTGTIMVYLKANHDYVVGDYLQIEGQTSIYNSLYQFTSSSTITKLGNNSYSDPTPEVFGSTQIEEFFANPYCGKYVMINGQYIINNNYRNLAIDGTNYQLSIYSPESSLDADSFSGKIVTVYGYLTGITGTSYVSFIITAIEEVVSDGLVKAILPSNWTNVNAKCGYNNKSDTTTVTMNKSDFGYWEAIINEDVDYISFVSGSNKTANLEMDFDTPCFVLTDKNLDGTYTGFWQVSTFTKTPDKLSILSVNDVHGYAFENSMAGMAYQINEIRNEDTIDNTILVANGDMFQGTAISNLTYGRAIVDCMNEMDFDFMGIGNHEFDWGIDKIINYFDGDLANGEANFKLVNSNIMISSSGELLSNTNVVSSLIIEKIGLKIGVLSYIDPSCYTSILKPNVSSYTFSNILSGVSTEGKKLKDQGCDLILVNVHGGYSTDSYNYYDIVSYSVNQSLAQLKYNGEYLVDAVINGHTHSRQYGAISRDGVDMPVIQAGANNSYLGEIELYIDKDTKKVVSQNAIYFNASSSNEDALVKKVIDDYVNEYDSILNEVCGVAGETVSYRSDLYDWIGNIMLNVSNADFAISNTGLLRDCNFVANRNILYSDLYQIVPFDNHIITVELTGSQIYRFASNSALFYAFSSKISSFSSLNNNTNKYKVAVVDYVYYWNNFPSSSGTDTGIILREAIVDDVRAKRDNGEKIYPRSNPIATIKLLSYISIEDNILREEEI